MTQNTEKNNCKTKFKNIYNKKYNQSYLGYLATYPESINYIVDRDDNVCIRFHPFYSRYIPHESTEGWLECKHDPYNGSHVVMSTEGVVMEMLGVRLQYDTLIDLIMRSLLILHKREKFTEIQQIQNMLDQIYLK